jgi:hypothetical protein
MTKNMKKINEYHSPAYEYVKFNRGVGHTTLIKDGGLNAQYPFIVLGADMSHAHQLTRELNNRFAIPHSIQDPRGLIGYRHPLLIDNYVFTVTCEGYISTVRDYREANTILNNELEKSKQRINQITNLPFWIRLFKPLYKMAIKRINEKG